MAEEVHVQKETETEGTNSGLKGVHCDHSAYYDRSVYSITKSQKVTQA